MKKFFLLAITTTLLTLSSDLCPAETNAAATNAPPVHQAPPPGSAIADLNDLVTRINAKITAKKNTPADLADNLKEFDALFAKHKDKGENPDDVAQILLMHTRLLMEYTDKPYPSLALPVFKQIRTNFPYIQINDNTDEFIAGLQRSVDHEKIRASLTPGTLFPDFNETDLDGKPLSISQYKGKVVLVDFWATWCMPCLIKLPEVQRAYEKFHSHGFEVVGISLDDDKAKLQQFTKQKKMAWQDYFDDSKGDNKLAMKYGVDGIPTCYLLDRDGKIIKQLSIDEDWEEEISKVLKK